jgi:hypothetical protein
MGKGEVHTGCWFGDLIDLVQAGVDGRIILKRICRKLMGGIDRVDRTQYLGSWSAVCKCGNELPDYIKYGEFLDLQRICLLVSQEGLWLHGVN